MNSEKCIVHTCCCYEAPCLTHCSCVLLFRCFCFALLLCCIRCMIILYILWKKRSIPCRAIQAALETFCKAGLETFCRKTFEIISNDLPHDALNRRRTLEALGWVPGPWRRGATPWPPRKSSLFSKGNGIWPWANNITCYVMVLAVAGFWLGIVIDIFVL
jgi:hypothetical protein